MDLERAIEFILDQQAKVAVEQAKAAEAHKRFEDHLARLAEQQVKSSERHEREIAAINHTLRRAIRLGVQEARAERKRRREMDAQLAEETRQLKAAQQATSETLDRFIKSLGRGANGGPQIQ